MGQKNNYGNHAIADACKNQQKNKDYNCLKSASRILSGMLLRLLNKAGHNTRANNSATHPLPQYFRPAMVTNQQPSKPYICPNIFHAKIIDGINCTGARLNSSGTTDYSPSQTDCWHCSRPDALGLSIPFL